MCLLKHYERNNLTSTCVIDVKPCDPNEWRRVDGTCNNLKHPGKGSAQGGFTRVLPPHFHNVYESRKAVSGEDLPMERLVRLQLLGTGVSSHHLMNHNLPGFGAYKFLDIASIHDVENMLLNTSYCCEKEHMKDRGCTPTIISDDDPVFRYSSIRCLNNTRPLTYQDYGCTTDAVPSMVKKATPFFDESQIYNAHTKGDKVIRTFKNGKLTMEEEDGKLFPPNGPTAYCPNNRAPEETRCFENYPNTLLPITLYIIWFVRHHNYICDELAKLNPCWDDDRLFYTARDINNAISNQIYFHEWFEACQGRSNLLKAGIITKDNGFRDLYDETEACEVPLEYFYVLRWFHLMQESTAKMYDKHGNYVGDFPILNGTFRMGFIAKNMESLTKSTFNPCHGIEDTRTVSVDVANNGLPGQQDAFDIPSADINKGRNVGLAPLVDYIYHFTGINITCFEDLEPFIPMKYIEIMKPLYKDVRNVDVMAGLWVSKIMKGGHIPELLAHFLNDAWRRAVRSDRHWYERPNRPHAFTLRQLKQIRKSTVSMLMCTVGDGVSEIPKKGFLKVSKKNPFVPCSKIQKIDFRAWADDACKAKRNNKN
ncbi:hypothetical protein PYW08_014459 [Mythimna loreyi]|uniref:Uncharacterized protein n=1 Tax=Mythimna loreyi TaxID=667449 RepID=A0ACC2R1Y1_9NEOP|nr:hypothetical protein PYW08_014459 [Mythimna loreyi]